MTWQKRLAHLAVWGSGWLILYKATQLAVPLIGAPQRILMLPGEENLPFLPGLFIFYAGLYLLPPLVLFCVRTREQFFLILYSYTAATVIHDLFYLLMPVPYTLRPALAGSEGLILSSIRFLYALDAPINNFPSLHVSFAFLSYFAVRLFLPQYTRAVFTFAVCVTFSTVLIKQHYVADAGGAILLAWVLQRMMLEPQQKTGGQARGPWSRIFKTREKA